MGPLDRFCHLERQVKLFIFLSNSLKHAVDALPVSKKPDFALGAAQEQSGASLPAVSVGFFDRLPKQPRARQRGPTEK